MSEISRERAVKNCELLFEYLRSILYDSEIQQPDFSRLDAPFENLGEGLRILQQFVEEMKTYTEELSNGDLSGTYPSRDNFLCANLKNLHANLNHLTWQAKRVAAGDYSQRVSYLGEFSTAFNTMIEQLKAREENLREQVEMTQRQMTTIEQYNQLFTDMMTRRNTWFVVVEQKTRKICYCNRQPDASADIVCTDCGDGHRGLLDMLRDCTPTAYQSWEWGDNANEYFRISSLPTEWRGESAFVHVAEDITAEKQEESKLVSHAYYDAGTGIYNRYFFEEHLEDLLKQPVKMVLCFMDLDGLKYVNDRYGHREGDAYINRFVTEIRNSFRATDIFARIGGDEFCLLLPKANQEQIRNKMEHIRNRFIFENPFSYPSSFSYGLVEVDEGNCLSAKELVDEADRRMYEYKKKNKLQRAADA